MSGTRVVAAVLGLCVIFVLPGCAPFPRESAPPPAAGWGLPMRAEKPPPPRLATRGRGSAGGQKPFYCVRGHGCYQVLRDASGYHARGIASWYGRGATGKPTASGAPYRPYAMRIANKRLPFGTWVRIRNLDNGRQAVAMVNDRGPFHRGRIIDASIGVAQKLGFYRNGTAPVSIATVPTSQLSATQREVARVDQRRAIEYARHRKGHVLAEAGHVAIHGVIDVTGLGLDVTVGVTKGIFTAGFDVLRWLF